MQFDGQWCSAKHQCQNSEIDCIHFFNFIQFLNVLTERYWLRRLIQITPYSVSKIPKCSWTIVSIIKAHSLFMFITLLTVGNGVPLFRCGCFSGRPTDPMLTHILLHKSSWADAILKKLFFMNTEFYSYWF